MNAGTSPGVFVALYNCVTFPTFRCGSRSTKLQSLLHFTTKVTIPPVLVFTVHMNELFGVVLSYGKALVFV